MEERAKRAAFLVATTTATACSLTTSLDGLTGGPSDAGHDVAVPIDAHADAASPPDAAPPSDVRPDLAPPPTDAHPEEGPPPPTNLVPNGGFDVSCDPWGTYNAALSSYPDGHNGKGCRVCLSSGTSGFGIDSYESGPKNPPIGTKYHGEMWVRSVPNAPVQVSVAVRTFDSPPFTQREIGTSQTITLNDTWQLLAADLTTAKPAGFLDLFAFSPATDPGACFLVDDAFLTIVP